MKNYTKIKRYEMVITKRNREEVVLFESDVWEEVHGMIERVKRGVQQRSEEYISYEIRTTKEYIELQEEIDRLDKLANNSLCDDEWINSIPF